jgi:hypothetical protein
MDKVPTLTIERDGLLESILALEAYRSEVYMNKDTDSDSYGVYDGGEGVKMAIDKLKDKLKLIEGQIEWYSKSSEGSKPSTTPR